MPFPQTDDAHTYDFNKASFNEVAGVYGILNAKKQIIYIGQTDNLKRRMDEHKADTSHKMHKYGPALVWFEAVTGGEMVRQKRETALIAEYNPPANA
jgi:predicted GIY-YIG superfamily endonuclease